MESLNCILAGGSLAGVGVGTDEVDGNGTAGHDFSQATLDGLYTRYSVFGLAVSTIELQSSASPPCESMNTSGQ